MGYFYTLPKIGQNQRKRGKNQIVDHTQQIYKPHIASPNDSGISKVMRGILYVICTKKGIKYWFCSRYAYNLHYVNQKIDLITYKPGYYILF